MALLAAFVAACDKQPSQSPTGSTAANSSSLPGTLSPPAGTADPGTTDGPVGELPAPTSADLIEAAVAAGRIDDATGLMYRIFATFGDPRLPGEYSTGRAEEDVVALMRAPVEIDSLPAEIAATIRPYIVRPTDPESAFHGTPATASSGTARTVAYRPPAGGAITTGATCNQDLGWAYADGSNWLRVWAPCGSPDEASIPLVTSIADQMYADERGYLGGQLPVADSGGPHQGGETRIDIYITGNCVPRSAVGGEVGPTAPPECLDGADGYTPGSTEIRTRGGVGVTSGFVLINRKYLGNAAKLRGTIAHELFHVFEYAYNTHGFYAASGAKWFLEASATWAEWRFAQAVPSDTAGPIFAKFQRNPLSLQHDDVNNGYMSFGWPLFMEQNGAGKVRAAWEAIVGKSGADAIMAAIDGVLPFQDNFRIFGMRGWNKEMDVASPPKPWLDAPPVSVGSSRVQPYGPKNPASIRLEGTEKGATPRSLPGDSPSLWAHYQAFTLAADVHQVVLDFSKVNPGSLLDVDALVKIKNKPTWERRPLPNGKTTWCIDNTNDHVEEFVIVLSNHGDRLTDQLSGNWTVDSPKEPCRGYHIKIKWNDYFNGVDDPFTFDGYADTINKDAQGDLVLLIGSGTYTGSRKGYIACNPGLEGQMPGAGNGTATFQAAVVEDKVTVSAFADAESTFGGVSTWPFEGPSTGTTDEAGVETPIHVSGGQVANASDYPNGVLCPTGYDGTATWELVPLKDPPPP